MKITFANKRRYFEIIFSEHTCKRFKITYSFESNETNDMERFKQAVNNLKIFPEKDSISIVEAATIMLSVCYGAAIVVMPYSIKQLGVAVFCLFLLIVVLLILYCSLAVLASKKYYVIFIHIYLNKLLEENPGKFSLLFEIRAMSQ